MTYCPDVIANAFNDYFTNVGPSLDAKIPVNNKDPNSFIKKNYTVNMFLTPCTPEEIEKKIENLKNCATGWDCIPANVLKLVKSQISSPIHQLMNLSLCNGVFPQLLKRVNIIPLFKAGKNSLVSNYRRFSTYHCVKGLRKGFLFTSI